MIDGIPHIGGLTTNGWTGLVTLLIVLGYLLSLGVSGKMYIKRLSGLSGQRRRMVNYSDEIRDWRADVVLAVSAVLGFALGLFAIAVRAGWIGFGFAGFAMAVGLIIVFLFLKWCLAWITRWIFRLDVGTVEFKLAAVYVVAGFTFLLIAMAAKVCVNVEYLGLSVVVLLACGFLMKFVILVENFFGKKGSLFYIFLYLCAAEILPLTVGFRFVNLVFN